MKWLTCCKCKIELLLLLQVDDKKVLTDYYYEGEYLDYGEDIDVEKDNNKNRRRTKRQLRLVNNTLENQI